ncbi:Asp23/Gls24 family envelope stress response protein [Streptomyces winkii]|uniref:Asp23/Gls24 family envelope stress response protein n=1 Tax=Streptomyces winkii TaxID=3051178 RepID=UPI0028D15CA4|nr:Asp23/Gls24 family envelope stress response protein [Streptomyces sp. DSM 40971]
MTSTEETDREETGTEGTEGAERGATTVVERVVAKVAVQAAREALRSAPAARKVPPGPRHWPRASARVRERTARVRVLVELGYPSDIGAQCAAVRRQVVSRVKELVGMDVPDVAVGVERLHSEQLDGERSGRVR